MAQQAAEKSLKAIILFLVGLKQDSHKLNELARLVSTVQYSTVPYSAEWGREGRLTQITYVVHYVSGG